MTVDDRRWFAIGDPQTTFEKFAAVLEYNELLGDDGHLRPEVGLVSMGDHFDYHIEDTEEARLVAAAEGMKILRWLAEHPRDQVRIIAGNHDLVRVQELHSVSDEEFRAIRSGAMSQTEMAERHPTIPTRACCQRDFSTFTTEQRAYVQRLLLDGRFDLALQGSVEGTPCLLTHAGITERELSMLDAVDERDPAVLASKLNAYFAVAIEKVRGDWEGGGVAALDLAPLHHAGVTGHEAGGSLAHRPANPDRPGADEGWEFDSERPRRFDPRMLPRGLTQVVGHTQHRKLKKELVPWVDPGTQDAAHRLRTVVVLESNVQYVAGVRPGGRGQAAMVCTDLALHRAPVEVALFELRLALAGTIGREKEGHEQASGGAG